LKVAKTGGRHYRFVWEIVKFMVLTALMYGMINLVMQSYDIQGPSMEPTLHNQERVIVDKLSYTFHSPTRGDVIIFRAPPNPSLDYIKRVVAIPGDVITVEGTTVEVDGVTLREPYVESERQGNPYKAIINRVVPPNDYFVMGDDRIDSSDSRDWSFVPRGNIIGRAALVYWPLGADNDGMLQNYASVFANIHHS
jgi:signal peptidase I